MANPEASAILPPAARIAPTRPAIDPRKLFRTLRLSVRVFRSNILSFAGFLLVVAIGILAIAVAVAPGLVLPYSPTALSGDVLSGPTWSHPLGTDELGRDMLSRVLAALPLDLGIGLGIAGASLLLGGGLGLVAGYWDRPRSRGGIASALILRLADIFLAFPTLVLALAIVFLVHGGLNGALVALLATWWPYYTRVTRGEVLAIKSRPYVTAARAAGVPEGRILTRHILRNLIEPLAVYYTLDVGTVIVTFSTIAYVGIHFPLNDLEWGNMVQFYAGQILPAYPWPVIAAGLMIFLTVLGFSLLGDGLRDVLDPRSRRVLSSVGEEAAPVRETLASPVDGAPAVEGP